MKIGLYSPFLAENSGGGERYLLAVAECLLPENEVDLIAPSAKPNLKIKLSRMFNLKLDSLNIISGPFTANFSGWARTKFTSQYDAFYYMTDGSFFIPRAKRNIVHFMIPFNRRPGISQQLKLHFWPVKVANSFFTKRHLEKNWRLKIDYVHYGAVDHGNFKPGIKKNVILHVGRFFSANNNKHCKRQDFLVKTFKKFCDQGLTGWQLILNGPIDPGQDNLAYFEKVKRLAAGYPVIFRQRADFSVLKKDYSQAKIYWHATGYGSDEITNPQAMEHLGMSTVEAMAAGAVPIVINKGGQPEIITHAINGLLWSNSDDLIKQTKAIIKNRFLWNKLSRQAIKRSADFSYNKFCHQTKKIFGL